MTKENFSGSKAVFVAGHRGMVGSAIVRRLQRLGGVEIVTATHAELDLTNQAAVQAFFAAQRIDPASSKTVRPSAASASSSRLRRASGFRKR